MEAKSQPSETGEVTTQKMLDDLKTVVRGLEPLEKSWRLLSKLRRRPALALRKKLLPEPKPPTKPFVNILTSLLGLRSESVS